MIKNNKIYLLSGIMGSGKDTFLSNNDLDFFSLSLDEIRKLNTQPDLRDDGYPILNNTFNDQCFGHFIDTLKRKLIMGGPVIINNMNLAPSEIKAYLKLATTFNYEVALVDFKLKDLSFYLENNAKRTEFKRLDEEIIIRAYNKKKNSDFTKVEGLEILSPDEMRNQIYKDKTELYRDVSQYKNVHFIGDIQGCESCFVDYIKNQSNKNKDDLYVFTGDYFDRGEENDKVYQFLLLVAEKKLSNFIFIRGNHEENLIRHIICEQDKSVKVNISPDFLSETLPQIKSTGKYSHENILKIYNMMDDFSYLIFHGKKIFVNHGGFVSVPKYPMSVSRQSYVNGSKSFNFDIDNAFNDNHANNEGFIQIHGHRNDHKLPLMNNHSFNLEDEIEFGGNLRILNLSFDGENVKMKPVEIKNTKYKRGTLMFGESELEFNNVAELTFSKTSDHTDNLQLIEKLRSHTLINEYVSEKYPHISSFNFTKQAFFDKSRESFDDSLVSHARGMFINTVTGEIVARGFEKFFNMNEKEETKQENIGKNYNFPLRLYEKENGFLGLIGYDSERDELVCTSKSRLEGINPEYFQAIIDETFSESEKRMLKRYAQRYNVNYIFEVIDIENDPHIVEYDRSHIVLLDIVKRDFEFQNVTYNSLVNFTSQFKNLSCKKDFASFNDEQSLNGFINNFSKSLNFEHEGFVVEDSKGQKLKLKSLQYSGWKLLRGALETHANRVVKFERMISEATRESVKKSHQNNLDKLNDTTITRFNSKFDLFYNNDDFKEHLLKILKREIKPENLQREQSNSYLYNLKKNNPFVTEKVFDNRLKNKKYRP